MCAIRVSVCIQYMITMCVDCVCVCVCLSVCVCVCVCVGICVCLSGVQAVTGGYMDTNSTEFSRTGHSPRLNNIYSLSIGRALKVLHMRKLCLPSVYLDQAVHDKIKHQTFLP